jgi:cyclopropane fatty-acyl-phospholipid synthase-like methyltransferase
MRKIDKSRRLVTLSLALIIASGYSAAWAIDEIPFVPTPMEVVDRMLEMAEVKKGDLVYDLGSGDGRIVIRAAKKYRARGLGIEMDPELIELSWAKAKEEGVSHLVEFRAEDALKVDVSSATVVTLYMLPWFNAKLRPALQHQLKPGSRVVAHDYDIEAWPPTEVVKLPEIVRTPGGYVHQHTLYLWRIEETERP